MKEVDGDLITMALNKEFDIIVHGCNCQNTQKAGIAKTMSEYFKTDLFYMETPAFYMNHSPALKVNKLGMIDWRTINGVVIINAYTQIQPGANASATAIALCMHKINEIFPGRTLGVPKIGCGIGGLEWDAVKQVIETNTPDLEVTVVNFKK